MQKLASEPSIIEIDLAAKKVLSSRSHLDLERGISTQIEDLGSNPCFLRHVSESKMESFSARPDFSTDFLKEPGLDSHRADQEDKQPDSSSNNNLTERFVQEGFNALENVILRLPTLENIISVTEEELSSKKWVINELHKLGLCENEIVQGIQYIDDIEKDISNKEELLKTILDVLLKEQEQHLEITKADRKTTKEDGSRGESPPKDMSLTQVLEGISYVEVKNQHNRFSIDLEEENRKEKTDNTKFKISGIKAANENNIVSCEICLEEFAPFQTDSILKCGHMFCWYCYKYYLNEKLDMNKVLNISCPKEGCQEKFEDHHLEKYLNQYTYSRYKRLKEAATLAQNPNLRWCIRPGCPKYIIGKPNSKKVVCECGMQMCFKCSNKYHSFWSCDSVVDKVYKKYAEAHNIQSCPQCQYKTEKNGGCDHITCGKCSYEWCWLCGLPYTKDHYENENPNKCIKLQKKKPESPIQEKYKQWSSRVRQNPLLILALPFIIMFLSAYLPVWFYEDHLRKRAEIKGIKDDKEIQVSMKMKIFLGFFGIVFFPITCIVILILWVGTGIRKISKTTCLKSKK